MPRTHLGRIRNLALGVGALVAGLAVAAPSAQAGLLVNTAPDCDAQSLSKPFLPWLDPANYTLAPGGDFESDTWELRGGAAVVSGNSSHYVGSSSDSHSLSLPRGSSATSPTICVGLEHPTLRFFAKNSGSLLSTLRVAVKFEDATGNVQSLPIGVFAAGGSWQPTLPTLVVANLLPLLPGERTPVAFEFTPLGLGGNWRIDDVYVDPWRRS